MSAAPLPALMLAKSPAKALSLAPVAAPVAVPVAATPAAPQQTVANDVLMRSIKILDIGYITVIYFSIGLGMAILVDKVMGKFDVEEAKKKPQWVILLQVLLHLWCYGVLVYVIRNLVELIPFPLNGYEGFQHKKVKELGSAATFGLVFLLFSSYLKDEISFVYKSFYLGF